MKLSPWVLVANSACARFFESESKDKLREVESLVEPNARLHYGDLVTDRAGRTKSRVGSSRSALQTTVDPKEQLSIAFAKTIADYLEKAFLAKKFSSLYISSSPEFLGHLREHFSSQLKRQIKEELTKDIANLNCEEIRSHFPEYLN
jgi:protein required for attachment to host cells